MGRSSQRHDASRQRGSFARFFGQRRNRRITPRSTLLAGLDSRPDDDDLTILSWPSRLLERLRSFFRILGHTALSVLKVSIVVGALGGMGLGAYLAYQQIQRSKHFDINRILVTGARHALPSEIIERVGGVKGRSIFDVDLSLVARTVQRHPWIKRSKVIRQLPRTLRIDVIEEHIEAI
ncbi:MAG: FtsQ-type POTRA domain-containing protein, partial [Deltaproteobacteria bacterium]|nr:FtsQ-type POTRA domain-containing protein [Deltaproteobacteria bacterium]